MHLPPPGTGEQSRALRLHPAFLQQRWQKAALLPLGPCKPCSWFIPIEAALPFRVLAPSFAARLPFLPPG